MPNDVWPTWRHGGRLSSPGKDAATWRTSGRGYVRQMAVGNAYGRNRQGRDDLFLNVRFLTEHTIMKIEFWKTTDIKPYEANPRLNDDAVAAVAVSIREFGFRQPVVVDEAGVIVVGHTRWKAAGHLGFEKVPVHVAKDLTPAQIKAYRITDNQTNTLADWDYGLLPVELAGLQDMDFGLDLLGFDPDELARLLDPDLQDGLTDPDEVPEPPDEAVTQPGDLWILGNHRLLCGDSANSEHVDRLLDGVVIHLVNSDPPYNVRVEPRSNNAIAAGNSSFSATNKHHQKFDLKRHPGKAKATHRKMRAKDRPLKTTSFPVRSSTGCSPRGSATSPASCSPAGPSTSGAGTPTAATTRRS